MNKPLPKTIEERFDNWIGKTALSWHLDTAYNKKRMSASDLEDCYNEIKEFVKSEASAQRKEFEAVVKSMIMEDPWEGLDDTDDWQKSVGMVREGHNQALNDLLKQLK